MGIVKEIKLPTGVLYIWHITETLEVLSQDLVLSDCSQTRLTKKRYEQHQKALYKMCNSRSLSFAQDMAVDTTEKQAEIKQAEFSVSLTYQSCRLEDYVLVVSQVKNEE